MSTVVITGGTGFLGCEVARQVAARADVARVLLLARSAPDQAVLDMSPKVSHQAVSILDAAALDIVLSETTPKVVFHLAGVVVHSRTQGREIDAMRRLHTVGTENVIRAAARVGARVVYASTSGTVACSKDSRQIADDRAPYSALASSWPYYDSKIQAEKRALELAEQLHVPLVVLRPSLLLGPGDLRLSSTRTVKDLLAGMVPITPCGGVSFVDVRDCAAAFVSAIERGRPGEAYLIGGANMTLKEYFARLAAVGKVRGPLLSGVDSLALLVARLVTAVLGVFGAHDPSLDPVVVEMSQCFWYLDNTKAREELGFSPRAPEETMADTIAFLRRAKL